MAIAEDMVRCGHTQGAVAKKLGYSNATSFGNAMRRNPAFHERIKAAYEQRLTDLRVKHVDLIDKAADTALRMLDGKKVTKEAQSVALRLLPKTDVAAPAGDHGDAAPSKVVIEVVAVKDGERTTTHVSAPVDAQA